MLETGKEMDEIENGVAVRTMEASLVAQWTLSLEPRRFHVGAVWGRGRLPGRASRRVRFCGAPCRNTVSGNIGLLPSLRVAGMGTVSINTRTTTLQDRNTVSRKMDPSHPTDTCSGYHTRRDVVFQNYKIGQSEETEKSMYATGSTKTCPIPIRTPRSQFLLIQM